MFVSIICIRRYIVGYVRDKRTVKGELGVLVPGGTIGMLCWHLHNLSFPQENCKPKEKLSYRHNGFIHMDSYLFHGYRVRNRAMLNRGYGKFSFGYSLFHSCLGNLWAYLFDKENQLYCET